MSDQLNCIVIRHNSRGVNQPCFSGFWKFTRFETSAILDSARLHEHGNPFLFFLRNVTYESLHRFPRTPPVIPAELLSAGNRVIIDGNCNCTRLTVEREQLVKLSAFSFGKIFVARPPTPRRAEKFPALYTFAHAEKRGIAGTSEGRPHAP